MRARRINAEQRAKAEAHLAEHPRLELTPQELDNLTRAIGGSIDGFDFETREASFGAPGRITVFGELAQNGRHYEVSLSIESGYRVFKDEL